MTEKYKKYVGAKLQNSGFSELKSIPDTEYIIANSKNNVKVCIKCVYSEFSLDVDEIETTIKAKSTYECSAAMIITNNSLTDDAKALAAQKRIALKENIALPQTQPQPAPTQINSNADKNTTPKKTKKKSAIIPILVVLLVLFLIGSIFGGNSDNLPDNKQSENQMSENNLSEESESETKETDTSEAELEIQKQKEKADFIEKCETVDYTDVARNPDQYKNKHIRISGEVIQVSEFTFLSVTSVTLRVDCNGDIWYVTYSRPENESRILEEDWITCYGVCDGVESYTSILGAQITIPSLKMSYFESGVVYPVSSTTEQDTSAETQIIEDVGKLNAVKKAKSYLEYSSFSREGLIRQLEFEGFTNEEAIFGTDNSGADWNEQAYKKAKTYLEYSAYSRDGLIDQLEYEGFTSEQIDYAIQQVGY